MKVFVIEDEIPAREELLRMLDRLFPDMEVAGTAGSVRDSAEWLRRNSVDLIFMDIQLSDGNCFDIFGMLEIHTPVIFTTAYDQYALKAFKVSGIGYLLKPVDEGELVSAVGKLDYSYGRMREMMERFFHTHAPYKTRISVKTGDSYSFLPMERISYFLSEDGLTLAVTSTGERYAVDYTIESIEPLLDPEQFFRATRGCIISIGSIGRVSRYFNSRLKVSLNGKNAPDLLISRARVPEFLGWLDGR